MKLTRVDQDGAGHVLEVDGESVVLGRKPARGLAVEHPTVSREHARLFRRDGDWNVADMNSSNGTFVNGRKVTRSRFGPGDVLKLGSVELRVEGAATPAVTPEPASEAPAAPAVDVDVDGDGDGDVEEIVLEDPAVDDPAGMEPIPPAARRPRTDDPDRTIAMSRRAATSAPPSPTSRPALSSAALRAERSGGVLGQDLAQQSFGKRLLYVAFAVAIAYGLFRVTSMLTETVVPEGGLPEKVDGE